MELTEDIRAKVQGALAEASTIPPLLFEPLIRGGVISHHSPAVVTIALIITALGCMHSIEMSKEQAEKVMLAVSESCAYIWDNITEEEKEEIREQHKGEMDRLMGLFDAASKGRAH